MEGAEWKRTQGEEDVKTADVLVRVFAPSHNSHEELLSLLHHSHVLCARSSFFAARLSQRWQPAQPSSIDSSSAKDSDEGNLCYVDIIALGSADASTYKRCMDLMYMQRKDMIKHHPFSGVHDALCMLCIASELLFEDCMDACMEFLDMLCSWTSVEEACIRLTLSSLQLGHIHRDLARRLSLPQVVPMDEPTLLFRRMLVQVLHTYQNSEFLDPSKPVPERKILQAWKIEWDLLKTLVTASSGNEVTKVVVSRLLLLFDKLVELRVADAVVRVFADDSSSSVLITDFFDKHIDTNSRDFARLLCDLLARMMQSVVERKVLLPQASRAALVNTWLQVGDTRFVVDHGHVIVTSLMSLIRSLPVLDREQLYKDSIKRNFKVPKEFIYSFKEWCDMLREVHNQLAGGCMILLCKG